MGFDGGDLAETEPDDHLFKVWPENWQVVEVFLMCAGSWSISTGTTSLIYHGIKLTEITTAMNLMNIPQQQQLALADDVGYMASNAAQELNRE